MPLSRRRMLAATLAAAVLAACGEPQLVELPAEFQGATDLPVEPPPTPVITNGAPATAPRGPVSVNLGIASGSPVAARLESLVHGAVADATAANPDLDLNVVQIAVGQGLQFRNDPAALIDAVDSALGDRGRLDLLIVATRGDLLWLQAEGLIQPLDRFFSAGSGSIDDYYPAGRQLVAFDGHSWALPLALVPTVLWYGEQQFATAGVDPPPAEGWTWADFRTAAQRLTLAPAADGSGGQWGHYFPANAPIMQAASMLFVWQSGGAFVDDDGLRSRIAEPAAIDAISLIENMIHQDGSAPATDPASSADGGGRRRRRFNMEVNGRPLATLFGPATLPFGVANLSQFGVRIGGMLRGREAATSATMPAAIAVLEGASDPADAFYALTEFRDRMESRMAFPARNTGIEQIVALSDGLSLPEAEAVRNALEIARIPNFPEPLEVIQIINREIEIPVISGDLTADEACQNAAAAIDALLAPV